jgi:hypothetical protein
MAHLNGAHIGVYGNKSSRGLVLSGFTRGKKKNHLWKGHIWTQVKPSGVPPPSPPFFSLFPPSVKVGEKGTIICLNPEGMIAE